MILPLEAHDGEVENGGHGRHVLHVVDKLAQESPEGPGEGEELSQLQLKGRAGPQFEKIEDDQKRTCFETDII